MTDILSGKKTYIGAAAVMVGAICKVLVDWYYGNPIDAVGFIEAFGVGLGILGIGVKIHNG